jgi:hypothetical protein
MMELSRDDLKGFGTDSDLKKLFDFDEKAYTEFWSTVKRRQRQIHSEKNIPKILLKERISGKSIADSGEAAPYLDINAQERGDLQVVDSKGLKVVGNVYF